MQGDKIETKTEAKTLTKTEDGNKVETESKAETKVTKQDQKE